MDLNEEVRDGYTVTAEMKKVWAFQMDLAKKLISVCDKHNLKIWADSGTLLGAVRHKGFIPWDDDMDFVMLREDYDKLLKLSNEFNHPYFLQSAYTEPGYSRFHAQLRNSNTAAILPIDINQPFNQGIFIDIFVFDDFPDNRDEWIQMHRDFNAARNLMFTRNYSSFFSKNIDYIKTVYASVKTLRKTSIKQYFDKTETILKNQEHGNEGYLVNMAFCPDIYKYPIRKREWFSDTVILPFEDFELPCPVGYHKILTTGYGDYMKPRQAPSAHGTVIFDTETPYTEVLKRLRKDQPLKEKIRRLFMPPYKK